MSKVLKNEEYPDRMLNIRKHEDKKKKQSYVCKIIHCKPGNSLSARYRSDELFNNRHACHSTNWSLTHYAGMPWLRFQLSLFQIVHVGSSDSICWKWAVGRDGHNIQYARPRRIVIGFRIRSDYTFICHIPKTLINISWILTSWCQASEVFRIWKHSCTTWSSVQRSMKITNKFQDSWVSALLYSPSHSAIFFFN